MTATLTAPETTAAGRASRGPHGLTWMVLRLHRTALVFWGLALTGAVAVLVWMVTIGDEARRGDAACVTPARDGYLGCAALGRLTVDDVYAGWTESVTAALAYAGLLVAAWAGAALVGRELESGTARLAWTQSVTPARWLAAKLAVPAALIVVGAGVVMPLLRWARRAGGPDLAGAWYYPDVFVATGPTAVAYPLAGLALGALAGLLLRRAVPAGGVGFAVALFLHYVLERLREDLWPKVTRTGTGSLEVHRSALVADRHTWTEDGVRHLRVTYHPESHFWPLQYVETGVLLALAAAATLTAFAVLRRRTP
ncbi:hypothetical protein [Streptomyces sp. NPDC098781]|uniref:hypothetical protein n=1 Tax=Streptomyces sp. NPDC098781 TaxID=3366097 RepID=UPI00381B8939